MIIYPRHFVRFIDGRAGEVAIIAFLPGSLGGYLRTTETNVSVRLDYARKVMSKKMYYEGFSEIQPTIDNGVCMLVTPYELQFLYVKDNVRPEVYTLVLKTDKRRRELWLKTFYRLQKGQYAKKLQPGLILREHAETEFMG